MTDFQPPAQSPFVLEMERLVNIQREAVRAKDHAAIEEAAQEVTRFLRLNALGRLSEWFASKTTTL